MNDSEIVKVVDKLVGNINPIADSFYDSKAYENIKLMGNVVDTLVCKIGNMVCENEDSKFASVEQCRDMAVEILKNINRNITEYLNEVE